MYMGSERERREGTRVVVWAGRVRDFQVDAVGVGA